MFSTAIDDYKCHPVACMLDNTSKAVATPASIRTNRWLLAALADGNPIDVRLQAIYLLADVAPDQAKKFLDDKEDIICCEAERIVGILPED